MCAQPSFERLVFVTEFDEAAGEDARLKGYKSHVFVRLTDGTHYPVTFYSPVRLEQDLEEEAKNGHPCIGYPAMVVVPEVTLDYMITSSKILVEEGLFDHLKSTDVEEYLKRENLFGWPP
jgi:hypothetical protein